MGLYHIFFRLLLRLFNNSTATTNVGFYCEAATGNTIFYFNFLFLNLHIFHSGVTVTLFTHKISEFPLICVLIESLLKQNTQKTVAPFNGSTEKDHQTGEMSGWGASWA